MLTHSEELFERYLTDSGAEFAREPEVPGKAQRPDYLVTGAAGACWFEIKEFLSPKVKPRGGFSTVPAIVEMVGRARKKFKEYRDDPCVLVLHSCKSLYRTLSVHAVASAMFGEKFRTRPDRTGPIIDLPERFQFFGTASLNRTTNTTISAIVLLQHYQVNELWVGIYDELIARQQRGVEITARTQFEILAERSDKEIQYSHPDTVRAVVLRNPHARRPLPNDLCMGPFDQHWDRVGSEYTLTWIGSTLTALRRRPTPVPFLYL